MTAIMTKDEAQKLLDREQPAAMLRKWLNAEAMAAYGQGFVDEPKDHEAAQADDLIGDLARSLLAAHDEMERLRADAQAAVALAVERAAKASLNCAIEMPPGLSRDEQACFRAGAKEAAEAAAATILALAPTTALADLIARERAEAHNAAIEAAVGLFIIKPRSWNAHEMQTAIRALAIQTKEDGA